MTTLKTTITTHQNHHQIFYFLCFLTEPKTILFIPKLRAYFPDTHPDQDQNRYSDSTSLYLPASQGSIPCKLCLSWMLCFDSPLIIWRVILISGGIREKI